MMYHDDFAALTIRAMIRSGKIVFAGNRRLKIFGLLSCQSGKRMAIRNRVFFTDDTEAIEHGYRPCGHCMRNQYRQWNRNQHENAAVV